MSGLPLSPTGPGGLLHNYGINYNMLETILPNYALIRRVFSRKVGIDISSVFGIAFIGLTLSQTCTSIWRHLTRLSGNCASWMTSSITLDEKGFFAEEVNDWMSEHLSSGSTRFLSAKPPEIEMFGPMRFDAPDDVVPEIKHYPAIQKPPIKAFLKSIRDAAEATEVKQTTIHRVTRMEWSRGMTRPSRPLSTVDLDLAVKADLVADIQSYLKARRFYARRGIPYRRGYLFHGPPGTGKTSLAGAIAGHFGLSLYLLPLTQRGIEDATLEHLFQMLPGRCVVMLEDVDAAGVTAERESRDDSDDSDDQYPRPQRQKPRNPVILLGLLNAIDGVSSKEGRILIMTSKLPDVLDKALIRPGRIDRQVFLGPLSKQNAKRIFLRMYTRDADEAARAAALARKNMAKSDPNLITMIPPLNSPISRGPPQSPRTPLSPFVVRSPKPDSSDEWHANTVEDLEKMATAFMNKIPDQILTPAEVQGFLLSHRDDMLGALTQCDIWVVEMVNAKQRKSNIVKLEPAPSKQTTGVEKPAGSSKPLPNPTGSHQ